MRATRALLVDRIGRVRKEALTVKDLDNVCQGHFSLFLFYLVANLDAASLPVSSCTVRASSGDNDERQE